MVRNGVATGQATSVGLFTGKGLHGDDEAGERADWPPAARLLVKSRET